MTSVFWKWLNMNLGGMYCIFTNEDNHGSRYFQLGENGKYITLIPKEMLLSTFGSIRIMNLFLVM